MDRVLMADDDHVAIHVSLREQDCHVGDPLRQILQGLGSEIQVPGMLQIRLQLPGQPAGQILPLDSRPP